jgi:ammonia channel protein AmtB
MDTRYVASARLEIIIKIIQILMFATFSIYIGLYIFYGYTLGIAPNRIAGEIYPLNLHGHIVYLNRLQHQRLEAFRALALFFGAIFASILAYIFYRRMKGCRVPQP